LPTRFGIGLAVPAAEPNTLFTVPIESSEYRCNPDGKFRVARSRDRGKNWKLLTRGGENWQILADNLPSVYSLSVAAVQH
jgi:hypothetical protein